jgi:hypothetical protein
MPAKQYGPKWLVVALAAGLVEHTRVDNMQTEMELKAVWFGMIQVPVALLAKS